MRCGSDHEAGHVAAPTTTKEFVADVRGKIVELEADITNVTNAFYRP